MKSLRAAASSREETTKPAAKPAERSRAAPAVKSLTYAERLELERIVDVIAELEQRVAAIESELASPELYASRGHEAKALGLSLEAARGELEGHLSRWEELESRRGSGGG
jgi:ATP-binding cassette subfamily F protein uup